ncbi:MAG: hypothetical protein QM569_09370, partial [Acidovorax sp.]
PTTVAARRPAAPAPAAPAQAAQPPDLAQLLTPLMGGLRIVRGALLLLLVLHGLALFVGVGSLVVLVAMAVVWWVLGWLIPSAPGGKAKAPIPQRKFSGKK